MEINFVKTSKKYEDKADEAVSTLFGLLEELLTVQERAAMRIQRLEQKQLTVSEKSAKHFEIFDKCKEEYNAVIAGRCTEKEMQWKHPGQIGSTPGYAYIKGEFTLDFTMKKSDTAEIVTHYYADNLDKKDKFVLKLVDGKWLVDAVYTGFENDKKWLSVEI